MTRRGFAHEDTLLRAEQNALTKGGSAIADVSRVRALLVTAARDGRTVSYSELLAELGYRFTRPKMHALCKTLRSIDIAAATMREPQMAVLVVRKSDRLPGQGWWTSPPADQRYTGPRVGPEAVAFVREIQERVFDYWAARIIKSEFGQQSETALSAVSKIQSDAETSRQGPRRIRK
jgi:hypothetical protein